MSRRPDLAALPGGDLVTRGIEEMERGQRTMSSLLVSIGAARLRRAGLEVPPPLPNPEHQLYALLATRHAEAAHGRYNALLRRLVSCERALECAR